MKTNAARVFLAVLLAVAPWTMAQAETLSGEALVDALRQGGYVLVMRHAKSPNMIPSRAEAAPSNFGPERQLDAEGQEQARAMGDAFKSLGVPVGTVLSSPAYRAIETVRYAQFGIPLPVQELGDGGRNMAPIVEEARTQWLRRKVTEVPQADKDMVLVTHAPNINSAFGEQATGIADGEAMVFRPDGQGGTALVARVKIGDWPILAGVP